MTPRNVVLEGDALEVLRTLAPTSVEAVITSPPYFRARRYEAGPAELGQEADVDTWVENLRAVSREIARVLVPTGSYWLNLGDVYSRNLKLRGAAEVAAARSRAAHPGTARGRLAGAQPRGLGQDDAAAVTGDGSVDERLGVRLAPGAPAELLLRPRCDPACRSRRGEAVGRSTALSADLASWPVRRAGLGRLAAEGRSGHPLGRNPTDVWTLPPGRIVGGHFATFPEALVRRPILATAPAAGLHGLRPTVAAEQAAGDVPGGQAR